MSGSFESVIKTMDIVTLFPWKLWAIPLRDWSRQKTIIMIDDNRSERHSSRFFTILSLCHELSPTCKL